MYRILTAIVVASFWGISAAHAASYSIKTAKLSLPRELNHAISALLSDNSIQLSDDKGALVATLWPRKELPAKASAEQVRNGLTYRELDETGVLGAIRLEQGMSDYRQQKIKPGVYTIRLGFQPMDGDHMGTAPYPDFGLLVPAHADAKPEPVSAKELQEMSAKASGGSHPAVFLLFPNPMPEDAPKLIDKGNGTWVLNIKQPVTAAGEKAAIGLGLTLIGHSEG
jgi:hypothetical protein